MLRAVLDTNLFVSSMLVRQGKPAQVLDAWRERSYLLVISPAVIAEIRSCLSYPRIRRKYPITDEEVGELIQLLENEALVVTGGATEAGAVPDDPDDELVLACAIDGIADFIVSGDRHLLDLEE